MCWSRLGLMITQMSQPTEQVRLFQTVPSTGKSVFILAEWCLSAERIMSTALLHWGWDEIAKSELLIYDDATEKKQTYSGTPMSDQFL